MTYQEIKTLLEGLGLPVTYYQWPVEHAPALPYIVFYYPGRNDFLADDKNYAHISELNIELYTDTKDFTLEQSLETLLEANDLVYIKEEQYISEERMYEVLYHMEVMING